MYEYKTKGVCSRKIKIELDGNNIKKVEFEGGCEGNTGGISRLVEGMKVSEAIEKLAGIPCGGKSTSCPDQLSIALRDAAEK